jgi:hypothetical protein
LRTQVGFPFLGSSQPGEQPRLPLLAGDQAGPQELNLVLGFRRLRALRCQLCQLC